MRVWVWCSVASARFSDVATVDEGRAWWQKLRSVLTVYEGSGCGHEWVVWVLIRLKQKLGNLFSLVLSTIDIIQNICCLLSESWWMHGT